MVILGEGNRTPLQYSCLENSMDRGAWWATVHRVEESQTWLSDFHFHFHISIIYLLEKAMAPHSSTLAWKIPWMEEPDRLQSMGSLRVGHDWTTSLSLFTFMHWRKEMANHCSVLAWRIPGKGEPGGLPSMASHRVRHDWSDLAAAEGKFWEHYSKWNKPVTER